MGMDDEIWNEDGTPRTEAVQAARESLREILKTDYGWKQSQIDKIVLENLSEKEEKAMTTREKAVDAALEAWNDDMRKSGWTEEQIEDFLSSH